MRIAAYPHSLSEKKGGAVSDNHCYYINKANFYFRDLSTANLKYLSSEQGLADLATFRVAMAKQYGLTDDNKWILFGGSYPGALAAWFRYKYPHLAHGTFEFEISMPELHTFFI